MSRLLLSVGDYDLPYNPPRRWLPTRAIVMLLDAIAMLPSILYHTVYDYAAVLMVNGFLGGLAALAVFLESPTIPLVLLCAVVGAVAGRELVLWVLRKKAEQE